MIWLGVAAAGALIAWLLDRRRRQYADRATTPAAALFAGFNLVKGRAWASEPIISHRTKTPSVWWDYKLEEERRHTRTVTRDGKTTTETYTQWHDIESLDGRLPEFEVVDDTGSALVRLTAARTVPRQVHGETFRREDDRGLLAKFFSSGTGATGKYRETERVVGYGDAVFVVGEVQLDEQRCVPVVADKVMVSTRTEESHVSALQIGIALLLLVVIGAAAFGTAVLLRPDEPGNPIAWGPGAAVAVLLLMLAWTITAYNRLRLVAEGADRAWSLIDVQLRRRHDLIPNLVSCVRAHTSYEQDALVGAAQARTSTDLSDEAEAQTRALRTLLAVAEATPELTTDESFTRLQRELADTENRIAGSRTFYNDSLTLLRDRQHRFPDLLIARRVPLAHRDLIDARGFERTVPSVERVFAR